MADLGDPRKDEPDGGEDFGYAKKKLEPSRQRRVHLVDKLGGR